MNNILIGLKKFFKNKNVVTLLGLIVIIGLLYWGYTSTINKAVSPQRIPVAKYAIQPRTEITKDMITYIEVPNIAVATNVKRSSSAIIGMYTDVNSVIPAGSMFYGDVLVNKSDLPDSAFTAVKDGEIPYALGVNVASTYGNSIFPGNVVDIYMKAVDESGQIMVGKFLAKVEILAVKDSSGNNVFEDTSTSRTPSNLLFGTPENIYILLKKAEYLKSKGVELFPVPYGGTVQIPADLTVGRKELVDYIEANTINFTPEVENTNDNVETGE